MKTRWPSVLMLIAVGVMIFGIIALLITIIMAYKFLPDHRQYLNNQRILQMATDISHRRADNEFRVESGDYIGELALGGYLEIRKMKGFSEEQEVDYAFFVINNTTNDLVYKYLEDSKGNSFLGENSIGLGCYSEKDNKIYSRNYGRIGNGVPYEEDIVENNISGAEFSKLISSNKDNQVVLKLEKPMPALGRGAFCYSHFRNFKLIDIAE